MRQRNNNYTPEGFFVSVHENLANSIKAEEGLRVGSTGLKAPVAAPRYETSPLVCILYIRTYGRNVFYNT